VFALALCAAFAAADDPPALPASWHGDWRGTLAITGANGKATEVPMALKIEPLAGARELKWAITYGAGAKAQVRDYKLVPDGDKPGRFKIDERNGIVLSARLAGTTLYSTFEVEGALLTARYELRGDALLFEITSNKKAEKTGDGKVQDYATEVVQRAELNKAK
jgi:hypothetical protein